MTYTSTLTQLYNKTISFIGHSIHKAINELLKNLNNQKNKCGIP